MATNEQITRSPGRHYLKRWRETRGLSQEELAVRVGTTKSVVSRWETGHHHPTLDTVFKIMAALEVTPAQFFSDPDDEFTNVIALVNNPVLKQHIVKWVNAVRDDYKL